MIISELNSAVELMPESKGIDGDQRSKYLEQERSTFVRAAQNWTEVSPSHEGDGRSDLSLTRVGWRQQEGGTKACGDMAPNTFAPSPWVLTRGRASGVFRRDEEVGRHIDQSD